MENEVSYYRSFTGPVKINPLQYDQREKRFKSILMMLYCFEPNKIIMPFLVSKTIVFCRILDAQHSLFIRLYDGLRKKLIAM